MSRIVVLTPTNDGMVHHTQGQAVAELQRECDWLGYSVIEGCSLLNHARNALLQRAIEADADWLLWLDSDMVLETDTLAQLYVAAQAAQASVQGMTEVVVLAPYMATRPTPLRSARPANGNFTGSDDTGLRPVKHVGLGCTFMSGTAAQWLHQTGSAYEVDGRKYRSAFVSGPGIDGDDVVFFGEDSAMCRRIIEAGGAVFQATSKEIRVGHMGRTVAY